VTRQQKTARGWSWTTFIKVKTKARDEETYRLDLKVADVLLLALRTPLRKCVAMELRKLGSWYARSQVESINILADDVFHLPQLEQGQKHLQAYPRISITTPDRGPHRYSNFQSTKKRSL
jgi:hypothetical protein